MQAVALSFGQLEMRIASMLASEAEPMSLEDLVKWINEAKDPKERGRRKSASFGALYGERFSMGVALPMTPGDNKEENTR